MSHRASRGMRPWNLLGAEEDNIPISVRPELVEGPFFLLDKEIRCFDKLGTNGLEVGEMTKGPVQIEMEGLLAAAFPGADFTLSNDSAQQIGRASCRERVCQYV